MFFFKNNINLINFFPEFSLAKNVTNKKVKAKLLFKKHNIKYVFCSNNYNKQNYGVSYYVYNLGNVDQTNNFKKFELEIDEDENKFLVQKKFSNQKNNLVFQNETNFLYQLQFKFAKLLRGVQNNFNFVYK